MSVNRVSPLSSHKIINDTQKPSSVEGRVSAFSIAYLTKAWQNLTGKSSPVLTTRVTLSSNDDYHSFPLEMNGTATKVQQTSAQVGLLPPHIKAAKEFISPAVKRGDILPSKSQSPKLTRSRSVSEDSVKSEKQSQSQTPTSPEEASSIPDEPLEAPLTEEAEPQTPTSPEQASSIPDEPLEAPLTEEAQPQTALSQSVSSPKPKKATPTDEMLKNENKEIRKKLARLSGRDESAFNRSSSKEIVEAFTKSQIKDMDLLDRFFETEKYNRFGPSKMASVRQLMPTSQLEKLLREVKQDVPKGQEHLTLNKEASSLIFHKNLDRMAMMLNVKINHEQFQEFKTADEALDNPPLNKLVTILNTYRISDLEKELISLMIQRFKQTFSSR